MEKQQMTIEVNAIINDTENNKQYRILYIMSKENLVLIEMNTTKFNVFIASMNELIRNLDTRYIISQAEDRIIEESTLTEKQKKKYQNLKSYMNEINRLFGPTYLDLIGHQKKNEFEQLYKNFGFSKTKAWRIIRTILQNGFDYSSILNKKKKRTKKSYVKAGRKGFVDKGVPITPDIEKIFEKGLEQYKKNRNTSFQLIYDRLCYEYFSKVEDGVFKVLPQNERPTYRQFYYYGSKRLNKKEMEEIKTSRAEFRNNSRLLLNSSAYNVQGPGDMLEMDALEMDVEIVSETNRNKVIGRPILYALIDVYSRAIVAISVSFENNSVLGMTNCLMNLGEDKTEFCQRYGISDIDITKWPSNFIPNRIRVDRGSDFVSKEAERIFNELNITREIVTGATGSMKGIIEQLWHQIHSAQNSSLQNAGLIEKRYDSTHKKKACLTIREITQMVIVHVLAYNELELKNFKPTKNMVKEKIEFAPVSLWNYGINEYGAPRPILNKAQYAYSLMKKPVARISRKGVCIDGLYYANNDEYLLEAMIHAGNRSEPFDCRYDERNITNLYYMNPVTNVLTSASLIEDIREQSDFINNTRQERLDFLENEKLLREENNQKQQTVRSSRVSVFDNMVKNAKKQNKDKELDTKNMIENRKKERDLNRSNNDIESRLLKDVKKEEKQPYDPIKALMEAQLALEEEEDKKYGIVYEED